MFCSQCGQKNSDTDKFCLRCGNPLVANPGSVVEPDTAPEVELPQVTESDLEPTPILEPTPAVEPEPVTSPELQSQPTDPMLPFEPSAQPPVQQTAPLPESLVSLQNDSSTSASSSKPIAEKKSLNKGIAIGACIACALFLMGFGIWSLLNQNQTTDEIEAVTTQEFSLDMVEDSEYTLECGYTFETLVAALPGILTVDCGGLTTEEIVAIQHEIDSMSFAAVGDLAVNEGGVLSVGTHLIEAYYGDDMILLTIEVEDTIAPEVFGPELIESTEELMEIDYESYFTVTDASGDFEWRAANMGLVDADDIGYYEMIIIAEDGSGNRYDYDFFVKTTYYYELAEQRAAEEAAEEAAKAAEEAASSSSSSSSTSSSSSSTVAATCSECGGAVHYDTMEEVAAVLQIAWENSSDNSNLYQEAWICSHGKWVGRLYVPNSEISYFITEEL